MQPGGILAVLNDLAPAADRADYEAWYQRDHLPDRLAVPGFRHARRYRRCQGDAQEYFTFYETDSAQTLRSAAYLARLAAPTDWTARWMLHFRTMNRTPCEVAADVGSGIGGFVAMLGAAQAPQGRDAVAALSDLLDRPGVTRARLWSAAQAMPLSPEAALRPGGDAAHAAILVVEGTGPEAVLAGARDGAAALGIRGEPSAYALIYASG